MRAPLVSLLFLVACGGTSSGAHDGDPGGTSGSDAQAGQTNAGTASGGASSDGGEASTSPAVNRCACGAGAMPPPECKGTPVLGAACDDAVFEICRIGFTDCFLCLASTIPGCASSE